MDPAIAPPWFAPVQQQLNNIELQLHRLDSKASNATFGDGSSTLPYEIVFFVNGEDPRVPPRNLPALTSMAVIDGLRGEWGFSIPYRLWPSSFKFHILLPIVVAVSKFTLDAKSCKLGYILRKFRQFDNEKHQTERIISFKPRTTKPEDLLVVLKACTKLVLEGLLGDRMGR